MAKNDADEASGLPDMERALEIALAADSPVAGAIVNNLAVFATYAGDFARTAELYDEALRVAERFGDAASARFIHGNRIWIQFMRGRLESGTRVRECVHRGVRGGRRRTPWRVAIRDVRASIRISRGDRDGALRDQLRSLELAQARLDLFHRLGSISSTAATYAELGRLEEARPLVREAVQLVRETGVHGALIRLGLHADALDAADDLRAACAVGAGPAVPFWRTAIVLTLDGELSAAADEMARAGNPTIEANVRRHAGLRLLAAGRTDEAEDELERALAFYRSVDASAYVAEIQAALAGAQRDSA